MAVIKIVPMPGVPGPNGASAYEVAVENGFEGTEQEWLDSLGSAPGIKTVLWSYPTPNALAIQNEIDGESIAIKSSDSAAVRWHVRDGGPSNSDYSYTASNVSVYGETSPYLLTFTIDEQDSAPPTGYYYPVFSESAGISGSYLCSAANTTSVTLEFDAIPDGIEGFTGGEITPPSVYSEVKTSQSGVNIITAAWTEPNGYSYYWLFGNDGSIDFPSDYSSGRTGYGDNLKFSQSTNQKIISTQNGTESQNTVERLVISGGDGFGEYGEGGDVYLWAGRGSGQYGSGGDIKVDAGNSFDAGEGGTVKIRGGYSPTGTGGFVEITSGNGNVGGNITINSANRLKLRSNYTPASSLGVSGDEPYLIAFDSDYMYYCTAYYDGTTNIWKRVALAADTWGV